MKEQDKIEIYDRLQIIVEHRATEFAKWISKRGYDDMFIDIDNDGKTWAYVENEKKRFTIKELYDNFMIDYICL